MYKTITQLSAILFCVILFTSCLKDNRIPIVSVEEDFSLPIPVDEALIQNWITDDVYIFPNSRDSILFLNAYDLNLKEKIWEVESILDKWKILEAELIKKRYLVSYSNKIISIFDTKTQEWESIKENDLIPDYRSANRGYSYSGGKLFGSLKKGASNSIIYSYDLRFKEVSIVYEYQSERGHHLSSIVFETDSNCEVDMYAVVSEKGDLDGDNFEERWKLLHIANEKLLDNFLILEDESSLYDFENRIELSNDLIAITTRKSVYIIKKRNGKIVTSRIYDSYFGSCQSRLIDDQLCILAGGLNTKLKIFNMDEKEWVVEKSLNPFYLNDIQIKDEYAIYTYSEYDDKVVSDLFVVNRYNNNSSKAENITDTAFSSPKYIPSLDQYIYHTNSRILWFDLEIEED